VLLAVTGASGVGKSTTLAALACAFAGKPVTFVEFDSVGVPADADTAWRHGVVEHWVQRALAEQRVGRHLVLCGQVAVGELLAAPSADALDGIAACVLHCSPEVRRARLVERGEGSSDRLHDRLAFGEWFHRHTLDPAHMPHVIRVASPVGMRWERWADWTAGDPRWSFEVIDTDTLTREEAAAQVVTWAREVLDGRRPMLAPGWAKP
jgi:hypothetical protein